MTIATLKQQDGAPASLALKCFAQRRSFRLLSVERASHPILFDLLLDWLAGKPSGVLPDMSLNEKLFFWSNGLLISPEELELVPTGIAPGFHDARQFAVALCPEIAPLFDKGLRLPSVPAQPDNLFVNSGYCAIPSLVGPEDVAMLSTFFRTLSDGNWLELSNKGTDRRRSIHNDPVSRTVQQALTPFLQALTGRDIKPSYTYTSEYCDESDLPRHVDRDQCGFTVSLYVDYRPDPASSTCPWPLVLHRPDGDVTLHQERGGGLYFLGREIPHSRPALPSGHRATMAFLHYVPADFDGSLD